MALIKDSSGKKSWTLTFCVLVLISTPALLWFASTSSLLGKDIIGLIQTLWHMTIGAFIAREIMTKAPALLEKLRSKK